MESKLISIAMCTYNGEKYIKEQLDSILIQTYKNFELIITDDGSSDKTINIIKKYQRLDARIKLYQNKTNLGFLKNFEKAISFCTGDYIALCDQDDIWVKEKLNLFSKNIKDNVLIYSDAIIIDKDSNEIGRELVRPGRPLCRGNCNKAFFLTNFVSGNTMMFKKELTKYILPIPEKISYHDIWIGFVASTYGTIEYTEESMTYYRRYSEQVTNVADINHKNFFEKLEYKKARFCELSDERATDLEVFTSLDILKDTETIKILNLLINHLRNYKNIYFNKDLYNIFNKHLDEVFLGFLPRKRKRKAFRTAVGLKLRILTLFKL